MLTRQILQSLPNFQNDFSKWYVLFSSDMLLKTAILAVLHDNIAVVRRKVDIFDCYYVWMPKLFQNMYFVIEKFPSVRSHASQLHHFYSDNAILVFSEMGAVDDTAETTSKNVVEIEYIGPYSFFGFMVELCVGMVVLFVVALRVVCFTK